MTKARIGLQLYTLRDNLADDFEGTIRQAAALGYQGVEFAGYYDRPAEEVRALLDELGLQTIGSHVGLARLTDNLQGEIDYLKTIGGKLLICPSLPKEAYSSEEAWKQTFAQLQSIGENVREQGLDFAYHNHAFEFDSQVDGEFAFDAMYTTTRPEDVKIEIDVCWVQFAGQDPLAYIRKYAGRIATLHLKDFTKNDEGGLVTLELGLGDVALLKVIEEANQAGISWLIVEQDNCQKPPLVSIANSMDWLKKNSII